MKEQGTRGPSWFVIVAWISVALLVGSLWDGFSSGPLFWAGAIGIEVLLIGWIYLLIRWTTRKVDDLRFELSASAGGRNRR
jgi:hypothetical protein